MSNDFLQWNPAQNNQETNSQYSIDTMRTGGAVPGVFAKELANKLFYQCTTMVSALGEMMSNKGYSISDVDISVLITALANILTKADFGSVAGTVCQGNDPRLNSPGVKVWFWQNIAPSGWTIDATAADAVLAVKGGSNAYYVAGGTQAGTWTQPSHLHTNGASHSHTTGDLALSVDQMPLHNHPIDYITSVAQALSTTPTYINSVGEYSALTSTRTTGSGAVHNHGATSTYAGGNTGASGTPATYRPLAQVGIICTKN